MKSKIRTGVDIVYIPKVGKLMLNKEFMKKVLHKSEMKYYKAESIAGIFAAKEAFFKALGKKPEWMKVELKKQKTGKPALLLANELKEIIEDVDVSISHDKDYAIAQVVLLLK